MRDRDGQAAVRKHIKDDVPCREIHRVALQPDFSRLERGPSAITFEASSWAPFLSRAMIATRFTAQACVPTEGIHRGFVRNGFGAPQRRRASRSRHRAVFKPHLLRRAATFDHKEQVVRNRLRHAHAAGTFSTAGTTLIRLDHEAARSYDRSNNVSGPAAQATLRAMARKECFLAGGR